MLPILAFGQKAQTVLSNAVANGYSAVASGDLRAIQAYGTMVPVGIGSAQSALSNAMANSYGALSPGDLEMIIAAGAGSGGSNSTNFNNATGTNVNLTGTFVGDGSGLTNLPASGGGVTTNTVPYAYPVTNAVNYASRVGITDKDDVNNLCAFENELRAGNCFPSGMDGMLLSPRWGSTNLSFLGNSMASAGTVKSLWARQFNGSGVVTMPVQPSVSNTIVLVMRGSYPSYSQAVCQLSDTNNTNSSQIIFQASDYKGGYILSISNFSQFPSGGITTLNTSNRMESKNIVGGYAFNLDPNDRRRHVYIFSHNGNGHYNYWVDGVLGGFGAGMVLPEQFLPVHATNAWNQFSVGTVNTNGMTNLLGYFGGLGGNGAPSEVFAAFVLPNFGIATNNTAAPLCINHAFRWLEDGDVNTFWIGASWLNYNSFNYEIPNIVDFSQERITEPCTFDYAVPGAQSIQQFALTNYITANGIYGKAKRLRVYYDGYINDLVGGSNAPQTWLNITNYMALSVFRGAKFNIYTESDYNHTNTFPLTWTTAINSNRLFVNSMIYSNTSMFASVIPRDKVLGLTYFNPVNNFAPDGVHFYGTLQSVVQGGLGALTLHPEYSSTWTTLVNIDFPGGATNLDEVISSTGWTNTIGVPCKVWLTAATGLSLYDGRGTNVFTGQTVAALTELTVQPNGYFTGTSITASGNAHTQ